MLFTLTKDDVHKWQCTPSENRSNDGCAKKDLISVRRIGKYPLISVSYPAKRVVDRPRTRITLVVVLTETNHADHLVLMVALIVLPTASLFVGCAIVSLRVNMFLEVEHLQMCSKAAANHRYPCGFYSVRLRRCRPLSPEIMPGCDGLPGVHAHWKTGREEKHVV